MHRSILFCGLILFGALSGVVCAQNSSQQSSPQTQISNRQSIRPVSPAGQQTRQLTPEEFAQMQAKYQPQVPQGFPLPADHEQYVVKVLDFWQQKSSEVKRSTATFRSWEYDPQFCQFRDPQSNQLSAHKIQDGKIRFSSPDKGQYEVNRMWVFEPKKDANGQLTPGYKPIETNTVHEKWICDGKSIYEYDFDDKRIYETEIPVQMQGQAIVNSPLPFFLFGANKELMLKRYWIRTVTPQTAKNEIWLEAYPKTLTDAQNYKKLEIILSMDDWLPRSLHIYAPNYDIAKNPQSRAYEFDNRQMNSQLTGIQDFFRVFVRPQKPLGWKWVKRDVASDVAAKPGSGAVK